MKKQIVIIALSLIALISCDPTNGPSSDCELKMQYKIDGNDVEASHLFNISSNPPIEIKYYPLENMLSYQAFSYGETTPHPYPFDQFFIDSITFMDTISGIIHYRYDDDLNYQIIQNDCEVQMTSQTQILDCLLSNGGEDFDLKRYAIFDLRVDPSNHDTFEFLEFRNPSNKNIQQAIADFAHEHIGEFDTVGIELVENKSNE